MFTVTMASLEGSDETVMSYGGLVDHDTIHGPDVRFLHDDNVADEVEGRGADEPNADAELAEV